MLSLAPRSHDVSPRVFLYLNDTNAAKIFSRLYRFWEVSLPPQKYDTVIFLSKNSSLNLIKVSYDSLSVEIR
jgi:hypothetical protein